MFNLSIFKILIFLLFILGTLSQFKGIDIYMEQYDEVLSFGYTLSNDEIIMKYPSLKSQNIFTSKYKIKKFTKTLIKFMYYLLKNNNNNPICNNYSRKLFNYYIEDNKCKFKYTGLIN